MFYHKTITVLGGDARQVALAEYFGSAGFSVRAWGLSQTALSPSVAPAEHWQEAVGEADVVVLPLPASPDSKYLNVPQVDLELQKPPRISEIAHALPAHTLLAGGRFSPALKEMLREGGVHFFDYFESELLQQKNAIPTAEGAVEILMREIPRTVNGLPVAVTGFGRVSRALVALLLAMGAEVTVVARKEAALGEARAMGCSTVKIDGKDALFALSSGYAAIFNTVPYWLFDERILKQLSRDTLLIDLASSPGGVDANAAAALGIRVIWALSLPGKYAPKTAGEIIAETILTYMREEEML